MARGVFLDRMARTDHPRGMADGYDIHIDEARGRRLIEAAELAGKTPEEYALAVLDEALVGMAPSDLDWAEDLARAADYDRSGAGSSVDEAFERIQARLRASLAARD